MTRVAKSFDKLLGNNCCKMSLEEEFCRDVEDIINYPINISSFLDCDNCYSNGAFEEWCVDSCDFGVGGQQDIDFCDLLIMAWVAYRGNRKRAGKVIIKTLDMWVKDIHEAG